MHLIVCVTGPHACYSAENACPIYNILDLSRNQSEAAGWVDNP